MSDTNLFHDDPPAATDSNPDPAESTNDADESEYDWLLSRRDKTLRHRLQSRGLAFRDLNEDSYGRIASEIADTPGQDAYRMTYKPARFEEVWLGSSLRSFYDQELIVDVLAQVKGGKEANVYRCVAHPRLGAELLAAKVYRPRKFRNLANDRLYREGRPVLTGDGRPIKPTDHRIMRALGKKTAFGAQVQHTSWLMYEYTTLQRLHQGGAAVPAPFGANENAILLGYRGDAHRAAPTLQEIRLDREEAKTLLGEVLRNIEILLQYGFIHGDLSAYNILYWEGTVTLIDFPQVTMIETNRNARMILERDIRRVCEYFARQGAPSDPLAIAERLWGQYGQPDDGFYGVVDM